MSAVDYILNDPFLVAILTTAIIVLVFLQRGLKWRQYYRIHRVMVELAPRVSPLFPTISPKPYRSGGEYLLTVDKSVRDVWQELVNAGASPHLIASVKVRETPEGETQYSKAHAIFSHADDDGDNNPEQTEAYLFANGDGSTDIYSHYEGQTLDPEDHLTGGQEYGDPHGVVYDALGV